MRDAGEQVALVALIDSLVPAVEREGPLNDAELVGWFATDLWGSAGKRPAFADARLQAMNLDQQIAFVLEQGKNARVLAPELDQAQLDRLFAVFKSHALALLDYTPQAYPYPTALLASEGTLAEYAAERTLGWGALVGPALSMHVVAGDHYSLMAKPGVRQLAEELRRCIDLSTR